MSSSYVRSEIKTFLSANSAESDIIDLTAQYSSLTNMLSDNGVDRNDPWLGLQFIGSSEEPITLNSGNTVGKYREIGSVFLHVVERVKNSVADDILTRAEALRTLLRGQRINDIIIESVSPPNFESGATLQFEGGYQSASIIVSYERDLNL